MRIEPARVNSSMWATSHGIISWIEKPAVCLAFITLIGAALRLYNLGFKSLWLDEAMLFQFANGSIDHVLKSNALYNSYPPLFTILLHAMMTLGTSETLLRTMPCIAGIASIPMMYYLAKNFVSERLALFAALLVAFSPDQIMYSQQVAAYSLTFLLAQAMLCAFLFFLQRYTWWSSLLFGAVLFVSICTYYGLAILALAINIIFFVRVFKLDKPIKGLGLWLVAQVFGLFAAYAVYHLSLKYQFNPEGFNVQYLSPGYWDGTLQNLLSIAIFNTRDIFAFAFPMTYLIILLVILGLIDASRGKVPMKSISLMMLLLPFAVTFVFALFRFYPYIGSRQTIFLSPMIYVFVAVGTAFVLNLRYGRYITLLLIAILFFQGTKETAAYLKSESLENVRSITQTLASLIYKDDLIYVYYGAVPSFEYYFRGNNHRWIVKGSENREKPDNYLKELDMMIANKNMIWFVFSHVYRGEGDMILQYVANRKKIKVIQREKGASLFVAY